MIKRTSGIWKIRWCKKTHLNLIGDWYCFSYKGHSNYPGVKYWVFPNTDDIGETFCTLPYSSIDGQLEIIDGPYPIRKFRNYINLYDERYHDEDGVPVKKIFEG